MKPPRILITGASGHTGRPLATALVAKGCRVRTATRGATPPVPGAEHLAFDWNLPASHDAALVDVGRMYIIAPGAVIDPERILVPFIERALAAGVHRVVLLSSSAIDEGAPGLGQVHAFMRANVPEWTVLRASWFMDNFIDRAHLHGLTLARDGILATATGDGRVPFVDVADIAAVAAQVLYDDRPHCTAYDVTGPEALSYNDVAAMISSASGRRIRHLAISANALAQRLERAGIPADYARLLAELDERIERGEQAAVSPTVQQVTGRMPRGFSQFAAAHAQAWTQPPPSDE
ncbi:MAG: NAD-dependent epimerase/dehydratase family protein [Haliangiales bacterium]